MFSPTFIIGNSARGWNTMLTGRWLGGVRMTDRPLIRMSPAVGSPNPAIMRRSVVLPQPDGPRMEKKVPGGICSETPATAVKLPKILTTSRHSRSKAMGKAWVGRRVAPSSHALGDLFSFDFVQQLAFHVLEPGRIRREPLAVGVHLGGEALLVALARAGGARAAGPF